MVKNEKGKPYPKKEPILHTLDQSNFDNFISSLDAVMKIGEDDDGINNQYVNPKLKHQFTFEAIFEDKFCFAFGFRAFKLDNGKFHKEIRFFLEKTKLQIGL